MVKRLLCRATVPSALAFLFSVMTAAPSAAQVDYVARDGGTAAAHEVQPRRDAPAAVEAGEVFLGYSDMEVNRNWCVGFDAADDPGVSLQAVRLTSEMLAPYVGEQLSGVRFGVGEEVDDVTVFVRETLTGANVAEATVAKCAATWNYVQFDEPLAISGAELYVGYSYYHEGERYVIGADRSDFVDGACYMGYESQMEHYFDDYSSEMYNMGMLLIQAIVGDDISDCGRSVSLLGADLPVNVQQDVPVDVALDIFNTGWEAAGSIAVTATVGGEEVGTVTYDFDGGLQPRSSAEVVWDGLVLDAAANVTFEISSVDGKANAATLQAWSQDCGVYEGEGFPRKLVLEYFTGQGCGNCPTGMQAVNSLLLGHEDDVICVMHHTYGYDDFTSEDAWFYGTTFNTSGSAPMMMLNRMKRTLFFLEGEGEASVTGVVIHPTFFAYANNYRNFLDAEIAEPARVSVAIDQDYDEAADVLNITVSGRRTEPLAGSHVGLTVMVLEDGQVAFQIGASENYVHNNIMRDVLSDLKGDVIEWDADGRYEMTYRYEIPEYIDSYGNNVTTTPDRRNMRVVAFVSEYSDDREKCMVYNAEDERFIEETYPSGIDEASISEPVAVWVSDGTFHATAAGEELDVQVFNLVGMQLPNNGIGAGTYIVRATDAAGKAFTTKMAVME